MQVAYILQSAESIHSTAIIAEHRSSIDRRAWPETVQGGQPGARLWPGTDVRDWPFHGQASAHPPGTKGQTTSAGKTQAWGTCC